MPDSPPPAEAPRGPIRRLLPLIAVLVLAVIAYFTVGRGISLEALVGRLRTGMTPGREYSPGDLRDLLGVSRKYLIPLLEFCDRRGITDRGPGGRTLRGT